LLTLTVAYDSRERELLLTSVYDNETGLGMPAEKLKIRQVQHRHYNLPDPIHGFVVSNTKLPSFGVKNLPPTKARSERKMPAEVRQQT
jgi:hypothetical protein